MSIMVPRTSDSRVRASARARIGDAEADALESNARPAAMLRALEEGLETVSTPEGLATFCELAARNLDLSAKVLLEAIGQGCPVGILRTKSWYRRNGAFIVKGERGYAASMFGGWLFPESQTTERFGEIGKCSGVAPDGVVAGYSQIVQDGLAGAVLTALEGYTLVVACPDSPVSLESLDRSLAIARGLAWNVSCISCQGEGCVLCSAQDDRSTAPVILSGMMNTKAKGRPRKVREPISSVVKARRAKERSDRLFAQSLKDAHARGASLRDIAESAGLSHARVSEIISQ